MWTIEQGAGDKFVTVRISADLGDQEMTRLKLTLKQRIASARGSGRSVRVLFDLADLAGPPDTVIRHFQQVDGELAPQGEDRVAVLVHSSLQKAIARAQLQFPTTQLFMSANAARTWLEV